jgi:hypothetical protein
VWLYFLSSRSRIALLLRDLVQFDGLGGDNGVVFLGVGRCAVASEACGTVCQAVLVEEDACQENAPLASADKGRE